ncbi:uncharacterized protein LOC129609037 [Condylostylus longicornis]|uniref:uncharacterized protein LOC129609037 n=1 Tax=Condylostylus longicornis TaxID=2530218 RepID=UPI00244DB45F|nr:uncharacterized protein LOC129609037 [Condylostylus longicornis]
MTSERIEWVEIIEPKTKEVMYANLTTGECVWDPPEGVPIKRTDSSQWWELFDTNTQRFYYYNVASQTTVWHRPQNCDIIPLAKLQTLKQNDERKDGCTQTSHSRVRSHKSNSVNSNKNSSAGLDTTQRRQHSSSPISQTERRSNSGYDARESELLSSPHGRHSYRLPSGDPGLPSGKAYCRHSQGSTSRSHKPKESGKSSDSSISSAQGYRRLNEGGSLRISNSHNNKNRNLSENYRILQESASSQNIPHSPHAGSEKQGQQHYQLHPKLSYSISNSSDLGGISPTRSANTPILKKKLSSETSIHGNVGNNSKRDSSGSMSKHQSIDYPSANAAIVSLTRSGSFMASPTSHHYIHQHGGPLHHQRKSSIDGNGGGASDDSMHEKYFKSVENTPISRRRHTTSSKSSNKKHSSDSSPQSPISPQNQNTKTARPSVLSSLSGLEPPQPGMAYNVLSSHKNHSELLNLDLAGRPEKYLDKMRLEKRSPGSHITHSSNSPCGTLPGGVTGPDTLPRKSAFVKTSPSPSSNKHTPSSSQYPSNNLASLAHQPSLDQYLSKSNIDRHNKEVKNVEKSSGKRRNKKHYNHADASDVEYDNGNISPLYSNWDQEMQEHLLPLQHYILEQAKLSGFYGFDPLDSDSYHSDSQSEHSFSGHEPDNEDSDHSDGHGDYLTHSYGLIDDYVSNVGDGVSYYAYQYGFDKSDREDLSENVEAVLESERENTQIYNNIPRNHQFKISPPSPRNVAQATPTQRIQIQYHQQYQKSTEPVAPSPQPRSNFDVIPDIREPPTSTKTDTIKAKQSNTETKDKKEPISILKKSGFPFHIPPPTSTRSSSSGIGSLGGTPLPCMKECDIEKFAQDNLNLHSKGIFRKKSSIRDMLSWTAESISRPMLTLARDKAGKKMATELFKLVQIYMGDRKARTGMSLNSVAIDIITTALAQQQLRDEMYVQLCRQTTENPKRESLIRGWELMAICLSFVPPSPTFQPALLNYVNRHRDPTFATTFPEVGKWPIHVQISHYATVCCRRLDRIGSSGRKQAKKPSDDEIEQARAQILRDSMFGNTIEEVMQLQKDKFPDRKLPWIQVTLSEQVLLLSGKQTEGIFRVPADIDEVNNLKSRLDRWEVPEHKSTMDAHAPASLLKLWYRELYDPLIPDALYNECVQTEDPVEADRIINKLPALNRLVLTYLVNFLQQFVQPDVVNCTKMDASNLAMVFAPNCLRCMSDDPKVILENARKEMAFMRTLIQNMDTSSVENLI